MRQFFFAMLVACSSSASWLVGLGIVGSTVIAEAAPIALGTIIGVDFGPTAPDNDYNQASPGGPTYGPFTDLNGVPVDSVGLTISGINFNNNGGTSQDLANYPAFLELNDSNTTDFIGHASTLTLTWTGLDDSLLYNVYGISSYVEVGRPLFVTWAADSQLDVAVSDSTTGGTLAQLLGLSTDGSGNLVVTVSNATDVPVANAIALQAVPEPSTLALLSLGLIGMLRSARGRTFVKTPTAV